MVAEMIVANKAMIGGAFFIVLFAAERLRPAAEPGDLSRLARNGALWFLLIALSPAIVLPLTSYASAHPLWRRPEEWAAPALIADFLILDLWTYWLHRAYHEVPMMRRFHRVHHMDGRLDTTSAVRFHPGEVAISAFLRMAPIILLSIPFGHVLIFETALLAASYFHHSNIRLPAGFERALSSVIVTPSIHWVHHHAIPEDTNSNYAAILSLWDPVFGTRSATRRTADMKIGLQGVEDKSLPGLLLAPFVEKKGR